MTCATCGFSAPDGAFCSRCGARQPAPTAYQPAYSVPYAPRPYIPRVDRHIERLGFLWGAFAIYRVLTGIIGLFFARAFFLGYGPWGWPAHHMPFQHLMHFGIGSIFFMAVVDAVIAYGLLQRQRWARPLALVFGVLMLFKMPFGTALGIYTLWVLAPVASRMEYEAIAE